MGGFLKDQPSGTIYISTLKLDDTDASNYLTFDWNENDSSDRTLGIAVGGGNRVITLSGNPTLADWFDQSVKAAASPTFASPILTTSLTVPTITGSTASGGSLTLNSTSHATKGYINLADMVGWSATSRNLKTWWFFDDFLMGTGANRFFGSSVSGTAASFGEISSTALRPGIFRLNTGTDTTGRAGLINGSGTAFLFGAGIYTIETDIYITTLSDGTDTYALRFGFGDSATGAPTDGAYFRYTDSGGGGATPNWYMCAASNTTLTATDTTVVAVAAAWTRLKIVVNAAGTSVEYFINGTSVGTVTTNIPTGTGRETAAALFLIKSAGTNARTVDIDWAWIHVDLTTTR